MKILSSQKSQSGFVLVLTLGFLIALTILGLAASGTTAIETLMARGFRDRDTAFAAAEIGVRDAEVRISGYYSNPASPLDPYSFPDSGASPECVTGLCAVTVAQPVHEKDFFASGSGAQELGDWTSSDNKTRDIVGLATQPRHMIERVCRAQPGTSATAPVCQYVYRITVQARGKMSSSLIKLQETYVP